MGFIYLKNVRPSSFHDTFLFKTLERNWDILTSELTIIETGRNASTKNDAKNQAVYRRYAGSRTLPEVRFMHSNLPLMLPDTDKILFKGTEFFKFDDHGVERLMSITLINSLNEEFDFLRPKDDTLRTYDHKIIMIIMETENPNDTRVYACLAESTSFPVPEWVLKLAFPVTLRQLLKGFAETANKWQNDKNSELYKYREKLEKENFMYQNDIFDLVRENPSIPKIEDWKESYDIEDYLDIIEKNQLHCYDKADPRTKDKYSLGYPDLDVSQVRLKQTASNIPLPSQSDNSASNTDNNDSENSTRNRKIFEKLNGFKKKVPNIDFNSQENLEKSKQLIQQVGLEFSNLVENVMQVDDSQFLNNERSDINRDHIDFKTEDVDFSNYLDNFEKDDGLEFVNQFEPDQKKEDEETVIPELFTPKNQEQILTESAASPEPSSDHAEENTEEYDYENYDYENYSY